MLLSVRENKVNQFPMQTEDDTPAKTPIILDKPT